MAKTKTQAGIGLLELMLSLAVISVLLVAVLQWSYKIDRSRKAQATVEMVQAVQGALAHWRGLPQRSAAAGLLSVDKLMALGLLDRHWRLSPWGRSWQLHAANGSGGQVQLSMPGMPVKSCRHVAAMLAQQHMVVGHCADGMYRGQLLLDGDEA